MCRGGGAQATGVKVHGEGSLQGNSPSEKFTVVLKMKSVIKTASLTLTFVPKLGHSRPIGAINYIIA